jgi:cytochrome c553
MKQLIVLGLGLLAAGTVLAEPSSNVAFDRETAALLAAANAASGENLAQPCASCHGANAMAANQMPLMAGQQAGYTYKQLMDYKDGKRVSPIMKGLVQAFTPQQMADVAAHYEAMPLPPAGGNRPAAAPILATQGDGQRLIPACDACHGNRGRGNPRSWGMPVLAGQNAVYFKATMLAFKSGARGNDVYSVMRAIAREMSEQEIDELAAWYHGQGG